VRWITEIETGEAELCDKLWCIHPYMAIISWANEWMYGDTSHMTLDLSYSSINAL
jgi:hypothetical protein